MNEMTNLQNELASAIDAWGGDSLSPGMQETPARFVRAMAEMTAGYGLDPAALFTTFNADGYDQMICLKDIEFVSLCEHHMLPFTGKAHIAYLPAGKIVGISKLARVLDVYARRFQVQERLCQQVTAAISTHLRPLGCGCIIEASHSCMSCRGVGKINSTMVTSSLCGAFGSPSVKQEFFRLAGI